MIEAEAQCLKKLRRCNQMRFWVVLLQGLLSALYVPVLLHRPRWYMVAVWLFMTYLAVRSIAEYRKSCRQIMSYVRMASLMDKVRALNVTQVNLKASLLEQLEAELAAANQDTTTGSRR